MRRLHHTSIFRGAGKEFIRASVMVLPHCVELTFRDYLDKNSAELHLTPERAVEIGERLIWLGQRARTLLDESNAEFAARVLAGSLEQS